MEPPPPASNSNANSKSALFKVYLRLRPSSSSSASQPQLSQTQSQPSPYTHSTTSSSAAAADRFITVEPPTHAEHAPTHITLNPPNDNRRRAVEKFAFTTVFEEEKGQLDVFEGSGVLGLLEGVLGCSGGEGRDGLLATLGVTGSGKTHTILGSRTQRGLTQLSLDVLFRSISDSILDPATTSSLHATVAASDPSEAQVMSAQMFIDSMFSDPSASSRATSRAPTPMVIHNSSQRLHSNQEPFHVTSYGLYPSISMSKEVSVTVDKSPERQNARFARVSRRTEHSIQIPGSYPESENRTSILSSATLPTSPSKVMTACGIPSYMSSTLMSKARKHGITKSSPAKQNPTPQSETYPPPTPRRNLLPRPTPVSLGPDVSNVKVAADPGAEYAILISMYEVYNDRIFDLLTPALPNKGTKDFRRRPLLFKPTEQSPDRKVVAGLRKIICSTMREALMVLEAGLHERRVAGTGSNSVSSRSHGFFCVEVKKRRRGARGLWGGSALTIVDLAGSERARDAKTQGATLQEAGKINESLMYLGQCLQMQSDLGSSTKPNLVPYRQCKLTELLFSNSFPSSSSSTTTTHPQRNPQKATMIVTADPLGDFNATSQILRYSALAREITVPRIPSVTSTILAASTASHYFNPRNNSGRHSPSETERETMEIAALEIARMSVEIDGLRGELISEQERNVHLEAKVESLRERELEIEADVREECYLEMEERFAVEMQKWKVRWAEEQERSGEHVDRKLEILSRMDDATDLDDEDKENFYNGGAAEVNEDLAMENERLKREVELLRREVGARSPSKRERVPLRESRAGTVLGAMEGLSLADEGGKGRERDSSPSKKVVRKLGVRKWGLVGEGEDSTF